MDILKTREIFKRYLASKTSPAENNKIDAWYNKLDEELPVALDREKEQQIKEDIWLSIMPQLNNNGAAVKSINYQWLKIAATMLLIGSAGFLFWKHSQTEKKSTLAITGYSTISTQTGQRKRVNLPDGTVITLNSSSSIRIANSFKSARNVIIEDGEAFFDVKHDINHPFIIKSGPLTTQVLGTAFNIRAYSALNKLSVGVTHGKVGVMLKNKATQYLVNNQQLVFDKKQARLTMSSLDQQTLTWQQGNMVLNDASFAEMAILMEKNYGLHISTNEKRVFLNHFTTTLSTSMPALKALEVITAIHHLKIKQRRDTIEIFR
jgi:transmembrane sensor